MGKVVITLHPDSVSTQNSGAQEHIKRDCIPRDRALQPTYAQPLEFSSGFECLNQELSHVLESKVGLAVLNQKKPKIDKPPQCRLKSGREVIIYPPMKLFIGNSRSGVIRVYGMPLFYET